MIESPREDLTFGQRDRVVDAVGPEILDQAVLKGTVLLPFGDIPQRGGVAHTADVGSSRKEVGKEKREAIIDLIFQERPGRWPSFPMQLVKGGVVASPALPLIEFTQGLWVATSVVGKWVPGTIGRAKPIGAPSRNHDHTAASGSPDRCKTTPRSSVRQGDAAW